MTSMSIFMCCIHCMLIIFLVYLILLLRSTSLEKKKTQMSQNAEQIAIRCESHPLILPGLLVESVKLSKIFLFRKTSSGIKQNTITLLAHEMSDEHQEILF